MTRFFRDIVPTIIQLMIVVILLPGLCFLLSLFSQTQDAMASLMNLLGEFPGMDTLANLLATLIGAQHESFGENFDLYAAYLAEYVGSLDTMLFEMVAIALCVKICKMVCELLKIRGVPLLACVIGVFSGCYISKVYDLPWMAIAFLMLLVMVIDMIFVRKDFDLVAFFIDYLKYAIELTIEVLSLVFIVGFALMLLIIWQGNVFNIGMVLLTIVMFVVPWFLLSALNRYVFST